jgi:hypothetical protein
VDNTNLHEELKRLEAQIESAAELAALKPIYFRLNEIIQAFPGDFEVQFTGNDIKQRLMARGTLLKQRETSPPPPPAPLPPEMPAEQPPSWPTSYLDTVAPAPVAAPAPPEPPVATPTQPSFTFFDSPPQEPPPPPLAATPENPPLPPVRLTPPPPPRSTFNWKRAVVIGPIAGLLVALVLVVLVMNQRRKVNRSIAARNLAAVQVDVATVPPGASVKLTAVSSKAGGSNETTCTSNCRMTLKPGAYQVSATLDGFEPVDSVVTVSAGHPAAVNLTLPPQAQSVRLLTDLDKGKVAVDDRPPVDLQEGQLVLDKVAPGRTRRPRSRSKSRMRGRRSWPAPSMRGT